MTEKPEPLAVIAKNTREDIRIVLDEYAGRQLVDVRTWSDFTTGPIENRGPTKKGVSLSVDKLPDLIAGLEAALAEARRRGLIAGG